MNAGARESTANQPFERESMGLIPANSGHPPLDSRLAVVLHYMSEHLDQPMKISVLSALTGLSASRFFELFKQATGSTPLNWFTRARMRRAAELLVNSDLQIKKVSAEAGYEDPFYFSRVFKSVYGLAPFEYRKHRVKGISAEPQSQARQATS